MVLLAAVLMPAARGEVRISEFLASNATGLLDSDRHAEDWIELHNPGTDPVSLEGWFLTDAKSNPTQWRFPAYTLGAGEYAVVFASGKNRTNPAATLHTNFKLGSGGEYLALVHADGVTVVSAFGPEYPRQFTDLSYGRGATAAGEAAGYFAVPTPGGPNGEPTGPPAVAPVLSNRGGTFVEPFDVTLLATPETAAIHFTLDGSLPSTNSPLYTAPIRIEGTRLLRARAFVRGLAPSPVVGAAYTRLGASVRSLSSDLPLVVVNQFSRTVSETTKNPVYVAFREPDPLTGFARLTREAQVESRAGMEIRGSSSAGFEKKSYGLEIQNESGLDRAEPLLGLPADSDWVLYAPYTDKSLIRDVLAYELSRRMGRYAPRTRFVELYLNRGNTDLETGDYLGVYVLIEKLKIAPDRVAVEGMEPDDLVLPEISGGYLLKRDRFDSNDQVFVTSRGVELGIEDPKRTQIGTPQRTWIRSWLGEMERALYGANWRDPGTGYRKYLDPGSFIDHQLLVEAAKNIDGYRLSTFWHKDREGLLHMGPIWDYNLTFGNADYLNGWRTNGWYWQDVGDSGYTWLRRLFEDSDFRQAYIDRWFEVRSGPFSAPELTALIDQLAGQVQRAQARNFTRWRILGQYVWPNWYIAPTWQAEIAWLKGWVTNRAAWMDSQFIAPPLASHAGGAVSEPVSLTLQPRRGTLYYTLEGTDPRQRGGLLSAGAAVYSAPLELRENARVVARSRVGTNWSAPYVGTFVFRTPSLAITEVMYQPAAAPGAVASDASAGEFIELRNVGTVEERLAGVRLSGAVEFRFPAEAGVLLPGERVVVVRRNDAWAGAGFRRAGEFAGELPDAGGTLVLSGPVGEPIQTVTYSARWYRTTAGGGYSLTVVDDGLTGAAYSEPANWRASVVAGGTPGRANVLDRGAPQVTVMRPDATRLEFRWAGTAGAAYVLQSCTNLAEPRWLAVRKVVAPGGAAETVLTEGVAAAETGRFYRVVTALE